MGKLFFTTPAKPFMGKMGMCHSWFMGNFLFPYEWLRHSYGKIPSLILSRTGLAHSLMVPLINHAGGNGFEQCDFTISFITLVLLVRFAKFIPTFLETALKSISSFSSAEGRGMKIEALTANQRFQFVIFNTVISWIFSQTGNT